MSKRHLQLHLSTLLLLAAAAGGLIYLNLQPGPGYMQVLVDEDATGGVSGVLGDSFSRGWPFACWYGYAYRPGVPVTKQTAAAEILWGELAGNVLVALVLLAALAAVLEKFVFGGSRADDTGTA